MKIDIHTHTKQCKSGDAPTREISPAEFCEKILSTQVKIVAITNHNTFDLGQYSAIKSGLGQDAQVWPGIELDVIEGDARGHLLVIVSPDQASQFCEMVTNLTNGSHPDRFSLTIEQVLDAFEPLSPIYVAHYKQKHPSLSEGGLNKLIGGTKSASRVIKEVSNSISAGIFISHGHASIYGSDVQDWATYETASQELPDLRLPVDSFDQFCLLLEKDPTTINTALRRTTSEQLVLQPFSDETFLTLQVYDDINVVFGAKGTGKTCILKAIAKHYSANGIDAKLFEPGSGRLREIYDLDGTDLSIDLKPLGIEYCLSDIEVIRAASEADVTSINKYVLYFGSKATNRNAKKILLKELEPEAASTAKRQFVGSIEAAKKTQQFLEFVSADAAVGRELGEGERKELVRLVALLLERLRASVWASFSQWKEIGFLNSAIELFRKEVERKTGSPAKPSTPGFRAYATNRMQLEVSAATILKSVDSPLPMQSEIIGTLGVNKGTLELRTEFNFQTGAISDREFVGLAKVKKSTQKKFVPLMRKIRDRAYSTDLFHSITELNDLEGVQDIKTVYELVRAKKYFALDGKPYTPSSGEASMVVLQKELQRDGDIYILDEPERSLDNEYISDVIVPLIKERARAGKKVFISTHDANIAVRTLPYCSIYRAHGKSGYRTYAGNPFLNNLVNCADSNDQLNWKAVSMKTLEGGEAAFGERGMIYGQS